MGNPLRISLAEPSEGWGSYPSERAREPGIRRSKDPPIRDCWANRLHRTLLSGQGSPATESLCRS